ncbi:hypothetical protein [Paenibacillus tundrae]|nr:hypothetical protein [Paenibacillus tundrae]
MNEATALRAVNLIIAAIAAEAIHEMSWSGSPGKQLGITTRNRWHGR